MGKLEGKVAIITGSTSGMGRDTAYLFAKEGAKVVITGRNEQRAQEVVDTIKEQGGQAIYVIADTSQPESAQQIFDATMDAYGTVDILFNNAGKLSTTPILEITMEEFQEVMTVNVTSALALTKLVAPVMKEKGEGHIINTSSVAGCAAHWGPVAYCTSKHAMNGLTKAMANELGPEIHVNGIQPGAIQTAMLDSVGGEAASGFMIERSPLKRIGQGSEIASVVLFLATKDSSFIDGQLIRVDGGVDI
ncbi:MAG: glucose 1-dehydrogenase [Erysipelotrichaceae bacterium]|nr:glucose 1-dehydrogenase [Erysipelotrichaceae bacterium]